MVYTFVVTLLIALICALSETVMAHVLPEDFVRCHPTDEPCFTRRFNDIVKNHANGYPEIELDKFEPFPLGNIHLKGDSRNPININLEMTDLQIYGLSNGTSTKYQGFTNDPKDIHLRSEFNVPESLIIGKYKVSGRLLLLPLVGMGDIEMILKGLRIRTTGTSDVDVRDGKKYAKITNYKLKIKVNDVEIKMTNLFNGDKVLGENMIKIINENWRLLWNEMEQQFVDNIAKNDVKIINKVFSNIPYDELFIIE